MEQKALELAVAKMNLPETTLRAVLSDYLDFLAVRSPELSESFAARNAEDPDFSAAVLAQVRAAMLAATLMLTLDEKVDFSSLCKNSLPPAALDPHFSAMRRELVSRALSQSKEIPSYSGISPELVERRAKIFYEH